MNPNRFVSSLNDLIQSNLADVHTALPAKITSVNYGGGRASVLPLVKTQIGVNKSVPYPELSNVPLVIMSGNGAKARLTFPVQPGDTVIVLFSERDPTNMLASTGVDVSNPVQSAYLGLYPIGILPCISTASGAKAISNEDVVLENDIANITLKPNGSITLKNNSGSISMDESGKIVATDGVATITLSGGAVSIEGASSFKYAGGAFNVNGLIIDANGKLKDSGGLSFDNHRHTGVETGPGISGGPVN